LQIAASDVAEEAELTARDSDPPESSLDHLADADVEGGRVTPGIVLQLLAYHRSRALCDGAPLVHLRMTDRDKRTGRAKPWAVDHHDELTIAHQSRPSQPIPGNLPKIPDGVARADDHSIAGVSQ
jgi:hypothetical protein